MGPIRNPRCEQKRTEGYVIVSRGGQACFAGLIGQPNNFLDNLNFDLGCPNDYLIFLGVSNTVIVVCHVHVP
jgi:hypothetical protein